MSRRNFMKIAASAAAGTVTTAGMERYVGPGAAAAPRRTLLRQDIGPDDKFYYHFLFAMILFHSTGISISIATPRRGRRRSPDL